MSLPGRAGPAWAVLEFLVRPAEDTEAERYGLSGLTEREEEVVRLLAHGLTNSAVARWLQLGDKTVRNYASNNYARLGVTDRPAAVARTRDAGY